MSMNTCTDYFQIGLMNYYINNRNRKLEISTAPTKAKSREPAYSQALVQKTSIGHGSDPDHRQLS